MAFHLEDGGLAVADIDHAGILAGPLDHPRRLGRQLLQMHARGFVGAMLAPHHREDAQLDEVRLAAHQLQDARIFGLGQPMFADQFRRDFCHDRFSIRLWNSGAAIGAAQHVVDHAFGMGHQAQHIALFARGCRRCCGPSHWGFRPWRSGRRRGPSPSSRSSVSSSAK